MSSLVSSLVSTLVSSLVNSRASSLVSSFASSLVSLFLNFQVPQESSVKTKPLGSLDISVETTPRTNFDEHTIDPRTLPNLDVNSSLLRELEELKHQSSIFEANITVLETKLTSSGKLIVNLLKNLKKSK